MTASRPSSPSGARRPRSCRPACWPRRRRSTSGAPICGVNSCTAFARIADVRRSGRHTHRTARNPKKALVVPPKCAATASAPLGRWEIGRRPPALRNDETWGTRRRSIFLARAGCCIPKRSIDRMRFREDRRVTPRPGTIRQAADTLVTLRRGSWRVRLKPRAAPSAANHCGRK